MTFARNQATSPDGWSQAKPQTKSRDKKQNCSAQANTLTCLSYELYILQRNKYLNVNSISRLIIDTYLAATST